MLNRHEQATDLRWLVRVVGMLAVPNRSGQSEQLGLELILGHAGADDLVLHFAVLEEQEERDRADIVFHCEVTRVVDIDLADFGLVAKLAGELIDDRSDHFAGSAPFGPEIDEDGYGGVDDFGIEICFGKIEGHGG